MNNQHIDRVPAGHDTAFWAEELQRQAEENAALDAAETHTGTWEELRDLATEWEDDELSNLLVDLYEGDPEQEWTATRTAQGWSLS